MKLNISKKSLFFKFAVILFAAGLLELMLFMTWENTVATLKGDAVAINMVGSESMRLLKIALLAEHYAKEVERNSGEKTRIRLAFEKEMAVFEDIIFGLRDGNLRYNLKKEESPEIIANLNQNIDEWNKTVKPMLQSMLFASSSENLPFPPFSKGGEGGFSQGGIKEGLKDYRQDIFAYVNNINGLVALFEKHSEEKVDRLRVLQFVFLFLSGSLALGSLIFIYLVIIKPIRRLNRAVTAMASGDLSQTVPALSKDEIGELGNSFNEMAIQLKMHMDSMDNMTVQLRRHIDALDEKIIEIKEQRQKYGTLVSNLNVGVYRRLADGQLVEVNYVAVAMFEADSKEDLLKRNVMDFYQDKNRMKEITDKILKYGFVKDEELEVQTINGRKFLCLLSGVAGKDKHGNSYFDGIMEDITIRKKLEERVRHSQKMEAIGELAAGVAHEINNPLASMAVCAESLMKRLQPDSFRTKEDYERFYNYLKIIEDEIYRSKNITTGLLDLSRKMGLTPKDVNINNLLAQTIKLIQLQQRYSAFIVRMNAADGLPNISADEGQLRQVFLAITKNAFDAMRLPGDLISISTTSAMDGENHVVKVIFKDSGCGIPKENLSRIFEAFFTTKGYEGTGLGLSVCYGIVSQHGGTIEVESEEGMGSTFTVILPVPPPPRNIGLNQRITNEIMTLKLKHKKIRILITDDEKNFSSVVRDELAADGFYVEVASDGKTALIALNQGEFDVVLLDINMPHLNGIEVLKNYQRDELPPEFIIVTGNASVPTAIEAMKLGAYDYITKPCKIEKLKVLIQKAWDKRMIKRDNLIFRSRFKDDAEIITKNPVMLEILDTAKMIAKAKLPVLISGESGTGKELMAKFIHDSSPRAGGPFIAFNAGAIPDSILESELFGYEKGAFTGAQTNKPGYFELADRGTLFLDEIGDISPSMQAKLLRSIETGRFFKVGGTKEIEVDIRIITATNKDLKKEVEANRFRHDLFYRLGAMNIHLPPLRERKVDISILVERFLVQEREKKKVDGDVMKKLVAYSWPGNIRELKNIIQRALILCKNDVITTKDLPLELQNPVETAWAKETVSSAFTPTTIQTLEKGHIKSVMKQVGGHRGKASQILGIDPKTLYRKIKEYGIE